MASGSFKSFKFIIRNLILVFIALPVVSANVDCGGKAFHCVNSTHFMICVDLGGGVSKTIDSFIIPCPVATECRKTNRYECEFPKPVILETVTSTSTPDVSELPPTTTSTSETSGISGSSATVLLQSVTGSTEQSETELFSVTTDISAIDKTESIKASSVINDPENTGYSISSINSLNNNTEQFLPLTERLPSKTHNFEIPLGVSETNKSEPEFFQGPLVFTTPVTTEILGISTGTTKSEFSEEPHVQSDVIQELVEISAPITTDVFQNLKDKSVGNQSEIFEVSSDVTDNVTTKTGLKQDPTEASVPITTEFIPLTEHTSLPNEISDSLYNVSEFNTTTAPSTTEIFEVTDNIRITNEPDLFQSSNGVNKSIASQLLDNSTDGNIINTTEILETSTKSRVLNKADVVVQEIDGISSLFTTKMFQIDANDSNITEHSMTTTDSTVFNEFLTNETSVPELLNSSTNVSKPNQTEVLEASLDSQVLNKSTFQEQDEIRELFNREYFHKSTDAYTLYKTEHPVASTDSFKFQELDQTTASTPPGPLKSSIDSSASTKPELLQALTDFSTTLITTEPFQSTTDVSSLTKTNVSEDFVDYKVQNETVFVQDVLETHPIIVNETDFFEQQSNSGVLNNSVSFPNTTSTSTPVKKIKNVTASDQSFIYQSTTEIGISSNETTTSFAVNNLQTATKTNVMHTKELLNKPAETTFLATTELSQASTSINGFNTTGSPQLHDNGFVTFSSQGEIPSAVNDFNNVTLEQNNKEEQIEWPPINANNLSAFETKVSSFNNKSNAIITDKADNIINSSTSSVGESDIQINSVSDLKDTTKDTTTSNTPIDSTTYDTTESHFSTLPSQDLPTKSDLKKNIETIDVIENDFTLDLNVFAAFTPPTTTINDYSYYNTELQEKNQITTENPTTFSNNALVSKSVLSTKETIEFTETNLATINPLGNATAEGIAQSHVDEIGKGTDKVLKTTTTLTTNNNSTNLGLASENPVADNLQPYTKTNLVQAISSPKQSAKIQNDTTFHAEANLKSTEFYLNISQSYPETIVINDEFATNTSKINTEQVASNNSIQMSRTHEEGINFLQNISTLPVVYHQIKSSDTTTETLEATTAKAVTQIRKTTVADEKEIHAFSNVIANESDMPTEAVNFISLATVGINQELLANTNIVENTTDIFFFGGTSSSNFTTEQNISESINGIGNDKVITSSFNNNYFNTNVVNSSQATSTEADLQHFTDQNTASLNIPETNLQPFLEGNEDNNTAGLELNDNKVNSLVTPLEYQSAYETLVKQRNMHQETLETSTRPYNDVQDLLQNTSVNNVNKNNNDFIFTSKSLVTATNAQVEVDSIPTKSLNSAANTSNPPINKMEIASPNTKYFSTEQKTDSNISSQFGVQVSELNETKNDAVQTIKPSLLSDTSSEPSIVMVSKQIGLNNTTDDQSLGAIRATTSEVNLQSNDTSILLSSSKDNISENTFINSTATSTNRDSVYVSPQVSTDVAANNQTFVKGSKNNPKDTLAQAELYAISGKEIIISNDEVRKNADTTLQVFGMEDTVTENINDNLYAAGAGNESFVHLNIFNIKTNHSLFNDSTIEVLKANSSLVSDKTNPKTDIVRNVFKNPLSSVYNISYNFGMLNGSVNNIIENNTTSGYNQVVKQTYTTNNDFINVVVPIANETEYKKTNSRSPENQNIDQDKLLLTKEERNTSQNTERNLTDSGAFGSVSDSKGNHNPNLSTNIDQNGSTSTPVNDNLSARIDSRGPFITIPINDGLAQATIVKKDIEQLNGTVTNGNNNIIIARNSTQVPGTINTGTIMVTKTYNSELISTPNTDNLSTSIYSKEPVITIPIYTRVALATTVKKDIGRRNPTVTNGNNNMARNSTQIPGTTDTGKVLVTNTNKNGSTSIPVMDHLHIVSTRINSSFETKPIYKGVAQDTKDMFQPNQTVTNGNNNNTLARNLTQIPGTINAGNVIVTDSNKNGSTSTPLLKLNLTQTYPRQPVVTVPIYTGGSLKRTVANRKNNITTVRRTTQIPGTIKYVGNVMFTNTNKNGSTLSPLVDNHHIVPTRVYSRQPVVTIPIYRGRPFNQTVANRKNNFNTTRRTTQTPGLINTRKIIVPFNCRNRNRGRYSDPKDCNKFYVCIGRLEPIIGKCPAHTVFSDLRKQCTNNMSHCVRESEFKCLRAGRFSDIWKQNIYYICAQRNEHFIRYKFQCQNGYYLNKTLVKCIAVPKLKIQSQTSISLDSKSDISNTEDMKVKKEAIKTQPSPRSGEDFECEEEGKFADENDCRRYYICTKNNKSEFRRRKKKCDSDELFHKDRKKCVDADSYEC